MAHYIDYKQTVWERINFYSEEDLLAAKKLLEEGYQPWEIEENVGNSVEYEVLYDTGTHLTPSENGGQSTVEVYKDDVKIWENGN